MKAGVLKVLVPTDFSENSRHALKYVLTVLGGQFNHLILLHAFREHDMATAPLASVKDILSEKSDRLLQEELKFANAFYSGSDVHIQGISKYDGYLSSLLAVTKEENVDLVVIGTNGHMHPRLESRDDDPSYLVHRLNRPVPLVPKIAN